jgi:TPP-dependent pyruvate/acetoin dehydrogenase alpha subunit
MIEQRDAEIEMVVQRLESESGSNTSDATRRYRMDIERIKSEAADEIKQVRCFLKLVTRSAFCCIRPCTSITKPNKEH